MRVASGAGRHRLALRPPGQQVLARSAFARPRAAIGPQPEPLGAARVWVLPNPSGLNAHTTGPKLAELMREMREATGV